MLVALSVAANSVNQHFMPDNLAIAYQEKWGINSSSDLYGYQESVMRSAAQKLCVAFALALICTACDRSQPIYNVDQDPIPAAQQKLSSKQIGKLIAKAAAGKGWIVSQEEPGSMHCTLKWKEHVAEVDITYTRHDYSIYLSKSENLLESDGMIHRRYNEYVHDLQDAIDKKLSEAGL